MPALTFGLAGAKSKPGLSKPPQKRKAVFEEDDDHDESDTVPPPQFGAKKTSKPLKPISGFNDEDEDEGQPPRKSPKLSKPGLQSSNTKPPSAGDPTNTQTCLPFAAQSYMIRRHPKSILRCTTTMRPTKRFMHPRRRSPTPKKIPSLNIWVP